MTMEETTGPTLVATLLPTLGEQIVAVLKESPHPLKLAEVVKKLPKPPRGEKAPAYKERIEATLADEARTGRVFSWPSGKGGETRYWGHDERHLLREKALEVAAKPAELGKLAKAVAKAVKGADVGFVEELLRNMIGAEVLYTHPPRGLIGATAPPPPPPPLGDQIVDALKGSANPLKLADVGKKLLKAPKGEKPEDYRARIEGVLADEVRSGRVFSCPSGKKDEVRYWGRDERHLLREKVLDLAAKPMPLAALAKAVTKEGTGADAGYVEGLLRDMIGAEVLFTHPPKGLIGAFPPPPPPPPLEMGKHPAAVKKLVEGCLKLVAAAGVGLEDVLAAVRKQAVAMPLPVEKPVAEVPVTHHETTAHEPTLFPVSDQDLERLILEVVEREGTLSLRDLRHRMPPDGRGGVFDRVVLALEDAKKVSLSRDFDASHFGPEEQAEFVREGEFLFTSIAKRS